MDKKGLKIGGNIIGGMIGLFFLLMFVIVLTGFQNGIQDLNEVNDNFNKLQTKFHIQFNPDNINQSDYNNSLVYPFMKIVYSMVDFTLYSTFEVVKSVTKFAYENQDFVNPKVLLWLVMLSLLAPIIIVVFKLLIIIFLLTKEFIQSRKEKKELRRIKCGNG